MKKFGFILFIFCYLSVQFSFSLGCVIEYVQKVIAEHQYKNHLEKLPPRFNLLAELNKFKEHKEHQQKSNLPDFNHQLSLSAHHQTENLSLPVQVSTPLIFTQQESLKPFFDFFSNTAPPPRVV